MKAQATEVSLLKSADSPDPSLLAYTKKGWLLEAFDTRTCICKKYQNLMFLSHMVMQSGTYFSIHL